MIFRFDGTDTELIDYLDYYSGSPTAMHNPPHPGAVLETMFEETPIKIAEAARKLHFSRGYLSGVVNCRKPILADLAVVLSELAYLRGQ